MNTSGSVSYGSSANQEKFDLANVRPVHSYGRPKWSDSIAYNSSWYNPEWRNPYDDTPGGIVIDDGEEDDDTEVDGEDGGYDEPEFPPDGDVGLMGMVDVEWDGYDGTLH